MIRNIPEGSKIEIEIETLDVFQVIIFPIPKQNFIGRVFSFFRMAFLSFWLLGWSLGGLLAIFSVLKGQGNVFILLWLCGWLVGMVLVSAWLYTGFITPEPQRIILNRPSLSIDSGTSKRQTFHSKEQLEFSLGNLLTFLTRMFKKSHMVHFSADDVKTLSIVIEWFRTELVIYKGDTRYEIGEKLSEVEKEWLLEYLKYNYSL